MFIAWRRCTRVRHGNSLTRCESALMSNKQHLKGLIHSLLMSGAAFGACAAVSMPTYAQDEAEEQSGD